MVSTRHPTAADLFAFSCGGLTRRSHEEMEAHVQTCPQCLNLLALLPDAPLAKLVREAVRDGSVSDHTPMPPSANQATP